MPGPRRLPDADAVLAAADRDPYVRNTVRPDLTHGWARDGAVVWLGLDAEERVPYVSALGPAEASAALVADVAPDMAPPGALYTLPVATAAALPPSVRFDARFHWALWTCHRPPDPVEDVAVEDLTAADLGRVADLLDTDPGLRSALPGDEKVRRWVGVRDGDRLVACAADTSGAPGVGHMGSVAVHPDARRRGLARAVVARLTADLLRNGGADGPADVVVVGVFVAEKPAMRLYERVGYAVRHEFLSGPTAYEK